jgi:hypothetical protein
VHRERVRELLSFLAGLGKGEREVALKLLYTNPNGGLSHAAMKVAPRVAEWFAAFDHKLETDLKSSVSRSERDVLKDAIRQAGRHSDRGEMPPDARVLLLRVLAGIRA